ncbi:hypothetical protein ACSBR2_015379 [Camellia fascicularis]
MSKVPKHISEKFDSVSLLLSSAATFQPQPHAGPLKKMYAFGDSYTDTGNTGSTNGPSGFSYVSNLPYGRTYFHHSTNRYSDGRLVIDFIAQSLSLPYLPPYLHLINSNQKPSSMSVNFAVAGSTTVIHSFFVKNNLTLNITPQSLQTQLTWFNNFLESQGCRGGGPITTTTTTQCNATINDALFWVGEIGANDYAYTIGSTKTEFSVTIRNLGVFSNLFDCSSFSGRSLVFGSFNALETELRGLDLQTGLFTLRLIKAATTNFDAANKIGEGGFGSVYKGLLSDGTVIAMKQLSAKSKQGNKEFVNEICMLSGLQHPNLVKLYGCCVEGNQLILIYEYMENNCLSRALFGKR